MDEDAALDTLSAMANRSRLAVLRHLVQAGPEGASAGEIATALKASPSQASFHLSALSDSGLVDPERRSRHIIYRINFDRLRLLVGFILEDCCGGALRAQDCCPNDEG